MHLPQCLELDVPIDSGENISDGLHLSLAMAVVVVVPTAILLPLLGTGRKTYVVLGFNYSTQLIGLYFLLSNNTYSASFVSAFEQMPESALRGNQIEVVSAAALILSR